LWRVLECKDVTILDMNKRFRRLLSCFKDWSFDPSSVISGEAFVFDDFHLSKITSTQSIYGEQP